MSKWSFPSVLTRSHRTFVTPRPPHQYRVSSLLNPGGSRRGGPCETVTKRRATALPLSVTPDRGPGRVGTKDEVMRAGLGSPGSLPPETEELRILSLE